MADEYEWKPVQATISFTARVQIIESLLLLYTVLEGSSDDLCYLDSMKDLEGNLGYWLESTRDFLTDQLHDMTLGKMDSERKALVARIEKASQALKEPGAANADSRHIIELHESGQMTTAAYNSLRRGNYKYVWQVARATDEELLGTHNLGRKCLAEIRKLIPSEFSLR